MSSPSLQELRFECLKFAQSFGDPTTLLDRAQVYFNFVTESATSQSTLSSQNEGPFEGTEPRKIVEA
jgi:hypothetical protein